MAVDPQAVIDLTTAPSHRSFAGHLLVMGAYVFIFGALAYLAFLGQGGIPGQLLLIYVSYMPLALAVGTVTEIARAKQRVAAHHVIAGCLNAVLLCGVGGIWLAFGRQLIVTLLGSMFLVWLTRFSPAAGFLRFPSLGDVAGSAPSPERRTVRALAMAGGALILLAGGIALTGLAVYGQIQRPGGLNITVGF